MAWLSAGGEAGIVQCYVSMVSSRRVGLAVPSGVTPQGLGGLYMQVRGHKINELYSCFSPVVVVHHNSVCSSVFICILH